MKSLPDRYCVFGHPVAHSKSPFLHAAFAAQTGQALEYSACWVPLDGFPAAVHAFVAEGGRGANVTVPFKEMAFQLATERTARAEQAGAVNTLMFSGGKILGDNTDGVGLLRDICQNLGVALDNRRVLLLGAGGAARGVIGPLLAAQPASVWLANRTLCKARTLVGCFSGRGQLSAVTYDELSGQCFDVVINATSASLSGALPPLPAGVFSSGSLAYDMMYGVAETPFLAFARREGAARLADGLGMLVEQAAETFFWWRGVRPDSAAVLAAMRAA